jgi:glucokinase
VITNEATLPAFHGTDLAGEVRSRFGWPCVIDNDAAAAAAGEYAYGAGVGSSSLLMVTLGTGIGVAVILGGRLLRAGDGSHPEGGHIAVPCAPQPCYCGLPSCWEQAASRTAFDKTSGAGIVATAERARGGDPRAVALFEAYGRLVASGLSTLLTLFRPGRVVVGGSAGRYLDLYAEALTAGLSRSAGYRWLPPVVPAALGDLAGAVGAAALTHLSPGR